VTWARSALLLLLAGLSIVCWGLSLRMAGAHVHGGVWPLFAMWSVMMVGMMVPVEAPSLVRLPVRQVLPWLSGYLAPWMAFSLAAAALQARLHHAGGGFAAALLIVAGSMQLSPWKRSCLERCRARPAGGFSAGLRTGSLSVLSCGLLMLIPLVTGMSAVPMVLLTLFCLLERAVPRASTVAGVGLAGWGVLFLAL
jgi:predicted metal-binding membrane protein